MKNRNSKDHIREKHKRNKPIKSKLKNNLLYATATLSLAFAQSALSLQESDFYTASHSSASVNLVNDYGVDNNFATDDSQALQRAINDISSSGGGIIKIPSGNYSFAKVKMKSDVRLEIDSAATIRPSHVASGNYSIFDFGNFDKSTVKNVSIAGVNGQFKIDLRNVVNGNVFAFTFSRTENFNVENVYIHDKNTKFQSFGFGHTTVNSNHYVPRNGLIKNAHAENTHYGYGLVQIQAGENILFKDISGTGGVTLRLESGWSVMNKIQPASRTPKIDAIYARNVSCQDGQAALFLMPHTIDQGFFDVRDVTSNSCEFAVKTEKGWVNQNFYAGMGLTEGSFSEDSIVDNIKSTYGHTAEIRAIMQRFIPCDLRDKIGAAGDNEEMNVAPAIAAVGDFAAGLWRGDRPHEPGAYRIQYSNIQTSGYLNKVPDVMDGDYCDYEQCSKSVWIPSDARGTFGACGLESNVISGPSTPNPIPSSVPSPTPSPNAPTPAPSPSSAPEIAKAVYLLKRNAASFAIDAGPGGANGQNTFLSSASDNSQKQQWVEIDRGNGYYSYQKSGTQFCLDGGNGGANAQNVYLWRCANNNYNQHWRKVNIGNGYARFEKRNAPNYSIDGGNGGSNGQNIYLWESNDNNQNQHWSFEKSITNEAMDMLVETENFISTGGTHAGFQTYSINGGKAINWNQTGDWADYKLTIATAGDYQITLLASTPTNNANAEILIDGSLAGKASIANNGSWDKFQSTLVVDSVYLSAGSHTLRLRSAGAKNAWQWNADLIKLSPLN
ncbi:carbohydrate-binding protein [Agaribacterium sp. ZY112]|uniref:carbohydrate-binding protein n=1 Tax=Agaribacterium sp. ZY112 TaxID=3233574 RepID=UPI003524AB9B